MRWLLLALVPMLAGCVTAPQTPASPFAQVGVAFDRDREIASFADGIADPVTGRRLRSGLWINRARGVGIAYFVTGLPDDPPHGRSAFRAAEEAAFRRTLALLPR